MMERVNYTVLHVTLFSIRKAAVAAAEAMGSFVIDWLIHPVVVVLFGIYQ